jgi:opacity protein-like surface antigen
MIENFSRVVRMSVYMLLLCLFLFSQNASAQNLEFNGGYAHISGNQGLNGFNVGAAWWFTPRVSLAADYDGAWNTSQLGVFQLTPVGLVASKAHVQDFLLGPRIFFPGLLKSNNKRVARLNPFAEAQFGVSHIHTTLDAPTQHVSQSASDTAFSWMLGGGADYAFSSHWSGRLKLDLLRTHFADAGQSRLRVVVGVAYTFGGSHENASLANQVQDCSRVAD